MAGRVNYVDESDAVYDAVSELRREGGGTVWIHRSDCTIVDLTGECPCHPIAIEVKAAH